MRLSSLTGVPHVTSAGWLLREISRVTAFAESTRVARNYPTNEVSVSARFLPLNYSAA